MAPKGNNWNATDKAACSQLQAQLATCWQAIDCFDRAPRQILVVPSLSLDQEELAKVEGVHHYEERLLFALLHLRNPNTSLIYVTSQPLHPSIVDYYLELLPGIPSSHAQKRLRLFSTYDGSQRPLTEKILGRPRLIERIRHCLSPQEAYMVCYNSTDWEQRLALALNIPLMALPPTLLELGTKAGSREIFAACGVPHPEGSGLYQAPQDLARAAAQLWERQPGLKRIVIKLNEGFSGEGNALLMLEPLAGVAPGMASHHDRVNAVLKALMNMRFQYVHETWQHFSRKIGELGAIAEAFIEGDIKRSPSVQGHINPFGDVEILSTHDQILGGPDGQIFLGCRFPADQAYRMELQEMGLRVGEILAQRGALERYSVDFIAVKSGQCWELNAIEINLRKGGTTHPFMALQLLTNGRYNLKDGQFYTPQGQPKYYRASDNLQKDQYRGLLPDDLMDIIMVEQLHFNSIAGTGAAFHLMGCLSEHGKLGVTCIGNTPEEAEQIYERVVTVLDRETS
ncbi:peptide ligase PGM1-related protein [Leptothoe sp. PORK10 BA2]|uniref:peptide ligase PGM1-related protein n=1 Tax=Leptothoe sp. PORK10 BA2 TaxID=3110254 RepID=UPI002B1F7124|nr:peptide ligase PGM1-related protein [Leptothoe sp. PORK10 BA2]MEA5465148.1 peptide ligase PGM1-related protein [Leptothoe sp. PORK10 BA2]